MDEVKRGPGRPRIWVDDAERMRAYRARVAHERALDAAGRPGGTYGEMRKEIAKLTRERDANWDQVTRLQDQMKALKRSQEQRPAPLVSVQYDNPDDAAEAAFESLVEAPVGTAQEVQDHGDCDAEIGRLEDELEASVRQRSDLEATVRRLEERNAELFDRLAAASKTERATAQSGQPNLSRAQRREAERRSQEAAQEVTHNDMNTHSTPGSQYVSTSPSLHRELLWKELDDVDPLRFRWLQEHPKRDEIMDHLVDIAIGFAHAEIAGDGLDRLGLCEVGGYDIINEMITDDVLGLEDIWDEIHDLWPREKPTMLDQRHATNVEEDEEEEDEEPEEWAVDLFGDYLDDVRERPPEP